MKWKSAFLGAVVAALLFSLIACGGGSSAVSVTIDPTAATLSENQTQQFTASVNNTSNTAVNWQVNGVTGGSATTGTISSTGLYTAPATITTQQLETITAVSQADNTKNASATVTLNPPTPTTPTAFVTVNPSTATLPAGAQQTFTASVNGAPATVTWAVACQSQTASDCGTINSSGVYTAPLAPPPGGTVTINATSSDTTIQGGNAAVTIQFANPSLSGRYAFSFTGQSSGSFTATTGSVALNGQGSVSGGVEDVAGNASSPLTITGGSYHVGTDGRGTLSLTTSSGTSTYAIVLLNHKRAFAASVDSGASPSSGTLDLQDTTQFNAGGVKGNYALSLTGAVGSAAPRSFNAAGAFTADGAAALTAGLLDVNNAGSAQQALTVTGSFTAPDSTTGRGTMTLTTSFGSQALAFYVVDATRLKLIESDATATASGDAFVQPAGPFSATSFRGPFVFVVSGATSGGPASAGGIFSLDGTSAVTATIDVNNNGNLTNSQSATGTYTVTDATFGRTTLSYNGAQQFVFYPSVNGSLNLLEVDSVSTSGTALSQRVQQYSNSVLSGRYAMQGSGVSFTGTPGPIALAGQLLPNGGGGLAGSLDVNDAGTVANSAAVSGGYNFAANGRTTSATVNTSSAALSNATLTFYAADANRVLFMESDSNRVLTGIIQKQF